MRKIYVFVWLLMLGFPVGVWAGDTLRVLFIGNSYTDVQNLPDVVRRLASAGGDSLYYRSSAPGGATFQQHSVNPATLNYISQGNWDYVVLQEQSQLPSFEDAQVAASVYPYARKLDSLVHVYSPCAKTMFYMTWGRKNGDAQNCPVWPPVCTYQGMDSLLQLRYSIMAENNQAVLCPVGKIWRRLRNNNPGLELYQADESHPTVAGTYAAALGFYSLLFGKDPQSATYNFGLSAADANMIKAAAGAVVYDSLAYWRQYYPFPRIDSIGFSQQDGTFHFSGINPENVLSYEWNFGDGTPHSFAANPDHTFSTAGNHQVCVTLSGLCDTITYCINVSGGPVGIGGRAGLAGLELYPNPVRNMLRIKGVSGTLNYTLHNYTGAKVQSGSIAVGQTGISVDQLPSGLYYLEVSDGKEGRGSFRFIKQ